MKDENQRAIEAKENLVSTVDRLKADPTLSDEGRRRKIATAYATSRRRVEELRLAKSTNTAKRREQLTRSLFASGGDPISVRDASDRVAALGYGDEQAALNMLETALMHGDDALAKAIVRRAVAEPWGLVLNLYVERRPLTQERLQELVDLESAPVDDFSDIGTFFVQKPAELALYSDVAIDALAADADRDTARGSAPTR